MSNTRNFKAGDTVYDQHGQEAEFVAASCGAYVVRPIYEDDDGPHRGEIETWSQVFRTAPAPKLDEKTAEAEKRLNELQQRVNKLRDEEAGINRAMQDRKDRIKLHEGLEMLDQYLAGEITHYVAKHDYYPSVEIIPLGETVENYSNSNGYGLLTLMPSRTWDKRIVFSVYYRDNKDRYDATRTKIVVPCCGEAAAKAVASQIIQAHIDAALAKERKDRRYVAELIRCCEQHGVPVPNELVDGIAEMERITLTNQRTKMAADLAAIDAKIGAQQ